MHRVYDGFDTASSVETTMWQEVLRIINEATVEGLAEADVPPTHDQLFYQQLRHSNEVFSAFKVHTMGREMAAKLLDESGHLKPFAQWARDVSGITSHQVGEWLRTEYDTAVLRAHAAADWQEFERNKDVMPNLRWMPTTSPTPEGSHRKYWEAGLTLPVDDPFWNQHHPGDRWNCKCSLEATDDPVVRLPGMEPEPPQRGLENNPGKDGHTFNDTHPYFPSDCKHCFAYKKSGLSNRLISIFVNRVKDCFNCPYINGCIDRQETKRPIDEAAMQKKQEVKEKDLMPKLDKQPCEKVQTGVLNRTYKVRNKLFTHCHHDYDVDAAVHIWNHPEDLNFIRPCELGEGKDMSIPKNQENIRKKREELHFVSFNEYEFKYKNRMFITKLAVCEDGYEQFYAIYEK